MFSTYANRDVIVNRFARLQPNGKEKFKKSNCTTAK